MARMRPSRSLPVGLDHAADWSADEQALYARVEDAGINASATPLQRWSDGWLLRFSAGKAKRARCVNALATWRGHPGDRLDERLAEVEAFYARIGMPLIVRITPFTQPTGLDAMLAQRGFVSMDDTRAMVCRDLSGLAPTRAQPAAGHVVMQVGAHAFAQSVGALRGSTIAQQQAHAQRLEQSPLTWRAFVVRREADGRTVAAGQVATEEGLVGLYDVHTDPAARGLGLATFLCRHALSCAASQEQARTAYLLVEGDNVVARRIYAALGFADAYRYHYRLRPGALAGA